MPALTDPTDTLVSFQKALLDGEIQLQPGALDKNIFVHTDRPAGTPRLTYVKLDRRQVTALAVFVLVEPIDGVRCFQIGYAVPEAMRCQGRAKDIVNAAMSELWNGLSRNGFSSLCIEAIVGADNDASKSVAAATISSAPKAITDEASGSPAFHYVRTFGDG